MSAMKSIFPQFLKGWPNQLDELRNAAKGDILAAHPAKRASGSRVPACFACRL
jgi:hypothetical protein